MKIRRLFSLFLLLLTCLALSACQLGSKEPQPVTDETTRAKLWEDYLYDAIGDIGNFDFASPEQAQSPLSFVHYTLSRMVDEGLLPVSDQQIALPPLAVMKEQLVRYFNTDFALTEDAYAELYTQYSGNPTSGTLYFNSASVSYAESQDWIYRLGEVTYDEAHALYQAQVEHIANTDTGRVDLIRQYVLGQRENGELYFISQKWQYPPLPEGLLSVDGDYTKLPGLALSLSQLAKEGYSVLSAGPFGTELLFQLRAYSKDSPYCQYHLFTYSSDLDQVLAQYTFSETPEHLFSGLRCQDERLLLRFTDGYCYLDSQLEATDSLQPLPETVRAAITTEPEWAGCYDFSQDEQTFYYLQNKQELWCYEASTQTSRQLFQRANLDFNGSYGLFQLQLTGNEQFLVMTLSAYDGPLGPYIVPVAAPQEGQMFRTFCDLQQDWTNADAPLPLMSPPNSRAASTQTWSVHPLDAPPSEPFTITPNAEQRLTELSRGDYLLYNDRYVLYAARHGTGGHPDDMTCALVRIDLQSPAAETLLTTKAADITPLAITDEGQVLFNYQFEQVYGTGISR